METEGQRRRVPDIRVFVRFFGGGDGLDWVRIERVSELRSYLLPSRLLLLHWIIGSCIRVGFLGWGDGEWVGLIGAIGIEHFTALLSEPTIRIWVLLAFVVSRAVQPMCLGGKGS